MKCTCGNDFEPMNAYNSTIKQKQCLQCLIKNGNEKRKKDSKKDWQKEKKELKTKLKTHSEWLKELQTTFNTYIRERDKGKPCISCDRPLTSKYDASHYFSVGAYPNLRFNADNVHAGCVYCNQHLHGNISEYAIRLPYRIGQERYDNLLLARNEPLKLSTEEIKEKIAYYKEKIKFIKLNRIDLFDQTENDKLSNLF
jgi:hypothetical protein